MDPKKHIFNEDILLSALADVPTDSSDEEFASLRETAMVLGSRGGRSFKDGVLKYAKYFTSTTMSINGLGAQNWRLLF